MRSATILVIAGTRPEVLKLAPVIRQMRQTGSALIPRTCFSGQHVEILNTVLGDLDITPDVDFRGPSAARTLSQNVAWLVTMLDEAVAATRPDGVMVQGDTNTVLAGGLVGMHHQIPVFHVEAGLRTEDPMRPFPEEMNRRLVSRLATLHFAPTELARDNLLAEGIQEEKIVVTGNTGIDALRIYAGTRSAEAEAILQGLRPGARRILVTLHRRENAEYLSDITASIQRVAMHHPDVEVLWILHLNGMRERIQAALENCQSVHLLEPQSYCSFVQLMKASHFILTDSGGVQEEGPVLGKPVLVMRTETERPEAVEAGSSWLVGCQAAEISRACHKLLQNDALYAKMSQPRSPFGDGHASERIYDTMRRFYFTSVMPHPSVHPGKLTAKTG
jgi:UDP-N-acetylglucosamine 2-epimerase